MIGGCTNPASVSSESCNIGVIYGYVKGTGYQRILETEKLEPGKGYWILFNNTTDQAELIIGTDTYLFK